MPSLNYGSNSNGRVLNVYGYKCGNFFLFMHNRMAINILKVCSYLWHILNMTRMCP